ncbi:hypothetical protein PP304_gp204 [Gordonia phage Phendrix]|uniref:Serine protease n=2 Tax=Godonkavirus TaxID=2733178 RepID=A0A4D6E2L2_9CAUD|nr:hypothetical protein HOV33_gp212 [Gordonia phage GodonK]YP_010649163.1 hypothetical protein PP304_gp204 [Gordonia phage Phendrix]QBZ72744.1 hypothetical protein SEA_GODONK_135 [Gordonia phage GodonK]QDK02667.1 hypothetical protein SEA_PHENDRIX_129 [Gordonia phage Phendrix]
MKRILVVLSIVFSMLFFLMPASASAAPPTLRPGMGIEIDGGLTGGGTICSIAAIGHDASGRLLGLTAGHCIQADNPDNGVVQVSGVTVGHFVTKPTGFPDIYTKSPQNISRDGAFFEIVDGVAVSNKTPNGVAINRIGQAPRFLWHFCKFGQISRETCGFVTRTGSPFEGTTPVLPGDSGGAVYDAPLPNRSSAGLIGVTSAMLPSRFSAIGNILADAAPQGVVNFTPLQ